MVRLPAEYQEVEYLESTSTQWIDTGFYPTSRTRLLSEFWCASKGVCPFGARWTGASTYDTFGMFLGTAVINPTVVYYGRYSAGRYEGYQQIDGIVSAVDIDIASATLNTQTKSIVRGNFMSGYPIALFGLNVMGEISSIGNTKIYYFTLIEDGILSRDYIPCYRKADSKPGMYDLVTKQFFTNAGTGEFLVGHDCEKEPGRLELLQNLLMAQPHKETATGSNGIVTFDTDFKAPMKLTIPFEPVQEGTGDPSPVNDRPIIGWTGCEIHNDGKNLITSYANTITRNGVTYTKQADDTYLCNGTTNAGYSWIWVVPNDVFNTLGLVSGKSYILTGCPVGGSDAKYFLTLEDTASTHVVVDYGEGVTFTYNGETNLRISFAVKGNTNVTGLIVKPRLYEVEPQTIPITFTDPSTGDPMTVYGGTITLNEDGSADLTQTHHYFVVEPSSASLNADKGTMVWAQIYLPSNYYASSSTRDLYSNIFTNRSYNVIYGASASATGNRILVGLPAEYDTTVLIQQFFTDNQTQFAYLLATPTTYHFDNIGQLKAFLGTNNIWHDMNGDITVEYWNKQ